MLVFTLTGLGGHIVQTMCIGMHVELDIYFNQVICTNISTWRCWNPVYLYVVRGTLIDCSLQAAVNGFESFYTVLRARFHQLQSQGLDKIKQLTGRLSNAELELHL